MDKIRRGNQVVKKLSRQGVGVCIALKRRQIKMFCRNITPLLFDVFPRFGDLWVNGIVLDCGHSAGIINILENGVVLCVIIKE